MQLYIVFVTFTYTYRKKVSGIDKNNRYMPEVDENRAGGLKAFSMKKMKEMGKSA